MDLVTVFLMTLIHANLIYSKSVLFDGQYMDPTNDINSKENGVTKTQMNYGTESLKPQMQSRKQKMIATEMISNLITTTETIEYVQTLDPSKQGYINRIRDKAAQKQAARQKYQKRPKAHNFLVKRERAGKKQATRQTYIASDVNATAFRTTSEDTLRWLLSSKLPFPDPAPGQIGQADNGIMFPITDPVWRFEDYQDLYSYKERVVDEYQDCEGQRIQCIRDTEYNQPVCVIDLSIPDFIPEPGRMKGFASQCEVDWRNCIKRYELTGKYYAISYAEDGFPVGGPVTYMITWTFCITVGAHIVFVMKHNVKGNV